MKLIDHHGDWLSLEWGGEMGRVPVLTVSESEGDDTYECAYALTSNECRALTAVLKSMAKYMEGRE